MLKETLGDDVCTKLLFVHAYTGCDSTSRIFGIGKKKSVFLMLLKSDLVVNACASIFILGNHFSEDIYLGEDQMVNLFNGKFDAMLTSLHHVTFTKKVATAKAFVTPERLPLYRLQQAFIVNECIFK
jgi:hypothetical protein